RPGRRPPLGPARVHARGPHGQLAHVLEGHQQEVLTSPRISPPRRGGRYRRRSTAQPWLCPPEPQAKGGRFLPPNEVRREVGGSRSHQQDLPRDQPDPRVRHCPLPHFPSSGVPSPNLRLGDKAPRMSPPRSGGRYRRRSTAQPWLCPPEPQANGGRVAPPNEVRREVGGSRSHQQDLPSDQPDPRVRHCPLPHCPSSGVPFPQPSVGGQSPPDQSPTKWGK